MVTLWMLFVTQRAVGDRCAAGGQLADALLASGAASTPGAGAESTSAGDQCLAISAAFTNTAQSRRRHGLCSMLLLPAVSGSLNRLAFTRRCYWNP